MIVENASENPSVVLSESENIPVEIIGLGKKFGYRKLLEKVDLALAPSQTTLLLGPNGAGKSTFLKIVCGLENPTEGEIRVFGTGLKENPSRLREVLGVVSHSSHLYGDLTALENLQFYAGLRGIAEFKHQGPEVLAEVGLAIFSDLPVKAFSSGMLKRLSIAKLLLDEPRILLLDEPYTGLDFSSTEFLNNYLADFRKSGGTVLLVTHQIENSFAGADKIAVLNQGKLAYYEDRKKIGLDDFLLAFRNITRGLAQD